MSHFFESPKNNKKTNPIEYNYYENVKERHFLGKYRPDKESIGYKNSKFTPEIESFDFNNNNASHVNKNNDITNFENNGTDKLKFVIKSTIIQNINNY